MFFTERSEVKKFIAPTHREIDNLQIHLKKKKVILIGLWKSN